MPTITKAWMAGLDPKEFEATLAILRYWRMAEHLHDDATDWWNRFSDDDLDDDERNTVFWQLFIPVYLLFASMLYVLFEGLKKLKVEDAKLQEIEGQMDMERLRQFRNATFHFKPHFRHDWHSKMFEGDGIGVSFQLYKRQTFVIHKMRKLMKHNPHHGKPIATLQGE